MVVSTPHLVNFWIAALGIILCAAIILFLKFVFLKQFLSFTCIIIKMKNFQGSRALLSFPNIKKQKIQILWRSCFRVGKHVCLTFCSTGLFKLATQWCFSTQKHHSLFQTFHILADCSALYLLYVSNPWIVVGFCGLWNDMHKSSLPVNFMVEQYCAASSWGTLPLQTK